MWIGAKEDAVGQERGEAMVLDREAREGSHEGDSGARLPGKCGKGHAGICRNPVGAREPVGSEGSASGWPRAVFVGEGSLELEQKGGERGRKGKV